MSYEGYEVPIVLGGLGLQTDGPQSQLPPNAAIKANNVAFYTGVLAKSPGTALYTTAPLGSPTPIIFGIDWWPTPSQQRMVVLTSNGKVWKDTGDGAFSSGVSLKINETQVVWFTSYIGGGGTTGLPVSGTFKWKWNSVIASITSNWNDSLAQLQTALRSVTGLASATLTATLGSFGPSGVFNHDGWLNGFTFVIPGTNTAQPLLTVDSDSMVDSISDPVVPLNIGPIIAGATSLGTITTDTHCLAGGNEVPGNARKLFFYTNGVQQLAMMTGDSASITGITRPAASWSTGQYPTFGVMYNSRHIAISQHTIFICRQGDHTDFTTSETDGTGASQFSIFPGEGDLIIGAIVYKGGLLIFKRPFGMYLFQWNGGPLTDPTNVSITKLSDEFALGSPHAASQVLDDLLGGSSSGSIFSQKATNAYGSLEAGDVLQLGLVRNYIRQQFAKGGVQKMHAAYYSEKILAMFTGRDSDSSSQNQILMYDASGQTIRYSIETKDQPTCLFMRKDSNFILRPVYGADDGNVYLMDQTTSNVNGASYTGEFQTPYIDFSFLDPKLAEKTKLFDFLSITYQSIGNWNFLVDVFVDGSFINTITFQMKQTGAVLDSFVLDLNVLGQPTTSLQNRQQLKSCAGKAISFRIYNSGLNETFAIERMVVSFRESGEQNRSSKT